MKRGAQSVEVVLEPNLPRCIETTAREEFTRCTRALLGGEADANLAERAELLRLFLESAPFPVLRSLSESYLLEGKRVRFIISTARAGVLWKIDVVQAE